MNIAALQTARAGSKSVNNKNIMLVNNQPLFLFNVKAAKKSKYIEDIFVSTDCETIKELSYIYGYHIIDRPNNLCTDDASHYDTILHGLLEIEHNLGTKIDILIILLGNSRGATKEDIDNAIELLIRDSNADSVESVSELNMFNPFRAHKIINNKYLNTIIPQDQYKIHSTNKDINDKNTLGSVYFFNGSFWICKRNSILNNNGLLPFPWLGSNIIPYIQQPVFELDAEWQIKVI